jgi:hypothetical protein
MTPAQTPRPLKHRRLAGVLLQNTTTHPGVAKIRIAIQQTLHKLYYTRFNRPAQAGTARHRLGTLSVSRWATRHGTDVHLKRA